MFQLLPLALLLLVPVFGSGDCDALCQLKKSVTAPGAVLQARDANFSSHAQVWNPAWNGANPALIVFCTREEHVQAAVWYAKAIGQKIRVKSGGHDMMGWSTCTNQQCILVDITGLSGINVNPASQAMTVGSGARQRQIFEALHPKGFTMNYASGGSISIGGLVHGGGYGISTRLHSVISDSVVSARAVLLSTGEVVDLTSSGQYSDLLWAIKGGGGSQYAVVTHFELKVYPLLPRSAGNSTQFSYLFNGDSCNVTKVNEAFFNWVPGAPNAFQPFISFIGKTRSISIHGFFHGHASDFTSAFADFQKLAGASGEGSFTEKPFVELYSGWMGLDDHRQYMSLVSRMTPGLTTEQLNSKIFPAAETLESQCGSGIDCYVSALTSSTGAVLDYPEGSSAFPHRAQVMSVILNVEGPGIPENLEPWQNSVKLSYSLYENLGFQELSEAVYVGNPLQEANLPDWRTAYYGKNFARLQAIKQKYDSDSLLTIPESLGTPAATPAANQYT